MWYSSRSEGGAAARGTERVSYPKETENTRGLDDDGGLQQGSQYSSRAGKPIGCVEVARPGVGVRGIALGAERAACVI